MPDPIDQVLQEQSSNLSVCWDEKYIPFKVPEIKLALEMVSKEPSSFATRAAISQTIGVLPSGPNEERGKIRTYNAYRIRLPIVLFRGSP